jgi:5-methyltetrahydrofolate--homocysteine methyltransferase
MKNILGEQEKAREAYAARRAKKPMLTIESARANRSAIDWTTAEIAKPSFLGVRAIDNLPLEELAPYIDWSPFFHSWQLHGKYPGIFDDPVIGERARELFQDAQVLLKEIICNKWISAQGVYGFFPANSVGDDIEVYADESRSNVQTVFHTLRQQAVKSTGEHNKALADYIAPKESGTADYLGAFAVTAGIGQDELAARFRAAHDDYNAIMATALADRLAEAFAEYLHKRVRGEWGYGVEENLTNEDLIRERYRGIRPAAGYPACPDHTEKQTLFKLLEAEENAGISLTESCMMLPASSVSGLYFALPQAQYFAVDKIDRDQVIDYARRKGEGLAVIERWLGPWLNYDPE